MGTIRLWECNRDSGISCLSVSDSDCQPDRPGGQIYRAFVGSVSGGSYQGEDFDMLLGNRGCLSEYFVRSFG